MLRTGSNKRTAPAVRDGTAHSRQHVRDEVALDLGTVAYGARERIPSRSGGAAGRMRAVRRVSSIVPVVVGIAIAAPAAGEPTAVLDYRRGVGAEGCPDEQAIRDRVAARLGRDPFREQADTRVTVAITASPTDLHAVIHIMGDGAAGGERELHAAVGECAALSDAAALAIAMALDPIAIAGAAPGAPTVVAPGAAPDAPAVVAPLAPPPPLLRGGAVTQPSAPTSLRGRLEAIVGRGASPGTAIGLSFGAELGRGRWSLAVEGRADLGGVESLPDGGDVSGRVLAAALAPCVHDHRLAACAVVTAGALRAAGHDVAEAREVTSPYLAGGARIAWSTAERPLRLDLHLDALAPLARTELRVGDDAVWTTAPVAFVLGIGVSRSFL